MASAAKHYYTTRHKVTGERVLVETPKYYAFYRNYLGVRVKEVGSLDKRETATYAAKLEKQHEQIRMGLLPPPAPRARRKKNDKRPLLAKATMSEILAEFLTHLEKKEVGEEHRKLLGSRLTRMLDGLTAPDQITEAHVEDFIAGLTCSAQTRKHYLRHAKQFTRWLVRKKKALPRCPLEGLDAPKIRPADRKHVRRAEGVEFLAKLTASIRACGKTKNRITAEARVWLYGVAAVTGLRAKECSVLIPGDFRLNGDLPHIRLPGGRDGVRYTKNGEDVILPVPADFAAQLVGFLNWIKRLEWERIWPGPWATGKEGGRMLQEDLADAGLPYRDDRGRVFDFHSLRVTYGTHFGRTGAPAGHVQKAMRHSDPALTFNTYTDTALSELATYADKMQLGRAFGTECAEKRVEPSNGPQCDTPEKSSDGPVQQYIEVDW